MNLADFDYQLPREFIAQKPLEERDQSKLMALDRVSGRVSHHQFFDLPKLLTPGSVLVMNQSKVIPARLLFKIGNGKAEVLLIKLLSDNRWECMVKPGPKFRAGAEFEADEELKISVEGDAPNGLRVLEFGCKDFNGYLKAHGHTPLPPYIKEKLDDPSKYQTVYAKTEGSVAAPTAGFHFSNTLLKELKDKGIQTEFVTLHVSLGTFQPVKTDTIEAHQMHSEWFELSEDTAGRLDEAKKEGRKIVAVGTTSVRVLESCADEKGRLIPRSGETNIFIYPGYRWKFVDELITNFHVPKSTLLMLVSAFANREWILESYEDAKKNGYRFFSFGDAMYIK